MERQQVSVCCIEFWFKWTYIRCTKMKQLTKNSSPATISNLPVQFTRYQEICGIDRANPIVGTDCIIIKTKKWRWTFVFWYSRHDCRQFLVFVTYPQSTKRSLPWLTCILTRNIRCPVFDKTWFILESVWSPPRKYFINKRTGQWWS